MSSILPATQQIEEDYNFPINLDHSTAKSLVIGSLKIENHTYEIKKGVNKIGRDASACSIAIENKALSRIHAIIEVEDKNLVFIYDTGSTNKTKLGKLILKPQVRYQVNDGADIVFGNVYAKYQTLEFNEEERSSQSMLSSQFTYELDEAGIPNTPNSMKCKSNSVPESPDDDEDDDVFKAETQWQNKSHSSLAEKKICKSIPESPELNESIFNTETQCPDKSFHSAVLESPELNDSIFNAETQVPTSESSRNKSFNSQSEESEDIFLLKTQVPFQECPKNISVSKISIDIFSATTQCPVDNENPCNSSGINQGSTLFEKDTEAHMISEFKVPLQGGSSNKKYKQIKGGTEKVEGQYKIQENIFNEETQLPQTLISEVNMDENIFEASTQVPIELDDKKGCISKDNECETNISQNIKSENDSIVLLANENEMKLEEANKYQNIFKHETNSMLDKSVNKNLLSDGEDEVLNALMNRVSKNNFEVIEECEETSYNKGSISNLKESVNGDDPDDYMGETQIDPSGVDMKHKNINSSAHKLDKICVIESEDLCMMSTQIYKPSENENKYSQKDQDIYTMHRLEDVKHNNVQHTVVHNADPILKNNNNGIPTQCFSKGKVNSKNSKEKSSGNHILEGQFQNEKESGFNAIIPSNKLSLLKRSHYCDKLTQNGEARDSLSLTNKNQDYSEKDICNMSTQLFSKSKKIILEEDVCNIPTQQYNTSAFDENICEVQTQIFNVNSITKECAKRDSFEHTTTLPSILAISDSGDETESDPELYQCLQKEISQSKNKKVDHRKVLNTDIHDELALNDASEKHLTVIDDNDSNVSESMIPVDYNSDLDCNETEKHEMDRFDLNSTLEQNTEKIFESVSNISAKEKLSVEGETGNTKNESFEKCCSTDDEETQSYDYNSDLGFQKTDCPSKDTGNLMKENHDNLIEINFNETSQFEKSNGNFGKQPIDNILKEVVKNKSLEFCNNVKEMDLLEPVCNKINVSALNLPENSETLEYPKGNFSDLVGDISIKKENLTFDSTQVLTLSPPENYKCVEESGLCFDLNQSTSLSTIPEVETPKKSVSSPKIQRDAPMQSPESEWGELSLIMPSTQDFDSRVLENEINEFSLRSQDLPNSQISMAQKKSFQVNISGDDSESSGSVPFRTRKKRNIRVINSQVESDLEEKNFTTNLSESVSSCKESMYTDEIESQNSKLPIDNSKMNRPKQTRKTLLYEINNLPSTSKKNKNLLLEHSDHEEQLMRVNISGNDSESSGSIPVRRRKKRNIRVINSQVESDLEEKNFTTNLSESVSSCKESIYTDESVGENSKLSIDNSKMNRPKRNYKKTRKTLLCEMNNLPSTSEKNKSLFLEHSHHEEQLMNKSEKIVSRAKRIVCSDQIDTKLLAQQRKKRASTLSDQSQADVFINEKPNPEPLTRLRTRRNTSTNSSGSEKLNENENDRSSKIYYTRSKTKNLSSSETDVVPIKQRRKSNRNYSPVPSRKYSVLFTSYESKEQLNILQDLGGTISSIEKYEVVVTDKIRRTLKLMTAIALGKPIVSPMWLTASKKENVFLDPWKFILHDKVAEQKWNFSLKCSLEKAKKDKLLNEYHVFVTDSAKPSVEEMYVMAENCGATLLRIKPCIWPQKTVILTCPEDRKSWPLSKYRYIKIMHYEFLLTGILQQKLNWKEFRLRGR